MSFDPAATHRDLQLDATRMTVTKVVPGMYRSCRVMQSLQPNAATYFEFLFRVQVSRRRQGSPSTVHSTGTFASFLLGVQFPFFQLSPCLGVHAAVARRHFCAE